MTYLPPLLRDQRKSDAEHLKLLAIFHFVGAGLAVMGLCFLAFHYAMMRTIMDQAAAQAAAHPPRLNHSQQPPFNPEEFFAVFKWFYAVMGTFFVACGVLNLLSGRFILRRKNRTFSLIVAGFNCIHVPLGTVLGVFTFVVLLRSSVEELYALPSGAVVPPDPTPPIPAPAPASFDVSPPPTYAEPAPQGDATGGIIPYKNPPALIAYYCGVFSIIPFLGFFIGIAALCLGIAGLKKRKQMPIIRGSVHAWIGIICGSLSILAHLAVVALIISASRH